MVEFLASSLTFSSFCCCCWRRCDWLDKKNTIFGKIVGDTVYNMLRLNELEVSQESTELFLFYQGFLHPWAMHQGGSVVYNVLRLKELEALPTHLPT
jgi:hypothetical protein